MQNIMGYPAIVVHLYGAKDILIWLGQYRLKPSLIIFGAANIHIYP